MNYTQAVSMMERPDDESITLVGSQMEKRLVGEPLLADLMETIKNTKTELATEMDAVAIDVNHLRVDLRCFSDRVMATDGTV
ncbi:hypothetical protein NDU88_002862 [Pleurodeles waltl]|uniref:Uncharacterized protein n=1 Tax=Pleurodeles waltl TaxID=8319 RepID=A0AAV7MCA0_PLEWA|nr:hypothetical protein NDU88_002862 [Pleurodeles waltl]